MRTLICYMIALGTLTMPVSVSSSEYGRLEPYGVWKKIYLFLSDHKVKDAYGKSWYLSKALRPVTMTAITFVESKGTLDDLRGTCGEVSAFQILRPLGGMESSNFFQCLCIAELHLNEKLSRWKNLDKAISAYNGNPKKKKPQAYAKKVNQLIREIGSYEAV